VPLFLALLASWREAPRGSENDRKENGRKEYDPRREETFFASPHILFCHLLFYPSWSFRLFAFLAAVCLLPSSFAPSGRKNELSPHHQSRDSRLLTTGYRLPLFMGARPQTPGICRLSPIAWEWSERHLSVVAFRLLLGPVSSRIPPLAWIRILDETVGKRPEPSATPFFLMRVRL